MFLVYLDDSQLNAKLAKYVAPEWFRQSISELPLSADMLNVRPPISNAFTNKIESSIYVLASFMENRILTECNCRFAVYLQNERPALLTPQFREQLR